MIDLLHLQGIGGVSCDGGTRALFVLPDSPMKSIRELVNRFTPDPSEFVSIEFEFEALTGLSNW